MNYLSVEQLSKSYGVDVLFKDLTFGIQKGERVAFIARNGSGKSTMLKILMGQESADSGSFTFRNGIRVGYLGQKNLLDNNAEVLDVLFDEANPSAAAVKRYERCLLQPENTDELQLSIDLMDKHAAWDYEVQAKKLLSQFGVVDLNKQVGQLSGGQQKRLSLVKVLLEEPDILLLDEPTNHLDIQMIEWLEEYIVSKNFTVLLITHDRYFLDGVCNRILELDSGRWFQYNGGYDYYLEKKAKQEAIEASEVDKAKNLMRRELEWIRRQPKARGTKSKSRVDAFDGIVEKARSGKKNTDLSMEVNMQRMGSKILELHNVHKSFGNTKLIDGLKYVFKKGEKIGIVGPNGVGKSTLLEMIMGHVVPDSGKIVTGETIVFGYYHQQGMKLKPEQRVVEAIKDIAEVIPLAKGRKLTASQLLERFLFPKGMHYNQISKLSGGERRRLYLLTILMKNPNFLILDEPTNDFDIPTLTVLEDFLSEFPGCLLVVTHDRYFMDKVVDHLMVFEGKGAIKGYNLTYKEYSAQMKQKQAKTDKQPVQTTKRKPEKSKSNKLSYKEKMEFEQLEKDISSLEKEKEELVAILGSEDQDHQLILKTGERLTEIGEELDQKSDRWLELADRI